MDAWRDGAEETRLALPSDFTQGPNKGLGSV